MHEAYDSTASENHSATLHVFFFVWLPACFPLIKWLSKNTSCSMYGPCTVLDGKNIVVAGLAASTSCWWVQGRDRSWQGDRYLIVECPEGFNHHSTNGTMSALKPHRSTPFEPKRGQVCSWKPDRWCECQCLGSLSGGMGTIWEELVGSDQQPQKQAAATK